MLQQNNIVNSSVWIVEDESWSRNMFQETINNSGRYECVHSFDLCEHMLAFAEKHQFPDYILLDLHFKGNMSGLDIIQVLKQQLTSTKILVLTGDRTQSTMNTAIQQGVNGYLVKPIDLSEIIPALDEMASGKIPLSAEMARFALHLVPKPLDKEQQEQLTQQEKTLLPYFRQGKSDKEIAKKLFKSPETIHTHRKHVYRKLGVHGLKDFIIRMVTGNKNEKIP